MPDESENIWITLAWVFLGSLLGWGINELFLNFSDLTLWVFVSTVIITLVVCIVVFRSTRLIKRYAENINNKVTSESETVRKLIDSSLKHQAQIIHRDLIYPEMARTIRQAKDQVAIMTYFMYDWEEKRRTFLPLNQAVPGLEDFYDAIYECIRRPDVEYLRVWQVPSGREAEAFEVLCENPLHLKEIELIEEISRNRPDQARFIITSQLTTASIILVDSKHLFINVDYYSAEERVWYSPYMIFIKDATENAFVDFNSIIVRLTSIKHDFSSKLANYSMTNIRAPEE